MAEGKVQVPPHAGIGGLFRVIERLFALRGLTSVRINQRGLVEYDYAEGSEDALRSIEDAPTIRSMYHNCPIREVQGTEDKCPPLQLLEEVEFHGLYPLVFGVSDPEALTTWLQRALGYRFRSTVFGTPIEKLSELPSSVLVLFAGPTVQALSLDDVRGFKIEIPQE